jgi:EmrB/QacA subfamily drug resistance transporter
MMQLACGTVRFMMQRKWRVALIVGVGVFMSSLDLFIVNIAFPAIGRHFAGASLASLSWILTAYAVVFAALLVPAGRWADAFGRKRVFLLGLAIFVAASCGCALAPSVGALTLGRIVQAMGGALMVPTSLGLMLPEFGEHERHVAIGAWAATGGIAAAAGPPIGGLLVQADWRLVFLVNVPVGLLGLAFGAGTLRERREPNARRPDVLGALGLMLAIGALVVAIVQGHSWGWGSVPILALVSFSGLTLAAIWRRSAHHEAPVVEPEIVRVRSFALALAGSVLFFLGFGAMLLSGVLFLTSVWHESVLHAGLMLFPGPAMATAFSVPSARLGARVGFRLPGLAGGLLLAAGSLWYITHTGAQPDYARDYLPGLLVGGAGVGLLIPTLTAAGASSLPEQRFATGAALLTTGRQMGAALGVAVLVAVLAPHSHAASEFHSAWLITVVAALAAGLTVGAIGPARRPATVPDALPQGAA